MRRIQDFLLNLRYAFRPNKPRLVGRLIKAVLQTHLGGRTPLRYVDFSIGFACNLRCQHCFATALRHDGRRTMTPQDYGRVVQEAMDLGAVNFSFQGGEPLLYKNLDDILRASQPQRNLLSVTTNGTLLTEENLQRLRRAGVDILTVSLDSGIAAEHDVFRGETGTFDTALEGIRRALKHGFHVTVGSVVTHDGLKSAGFQKLLELTRSLRVILVLILPVPAGNWQSHQGLALTDEDQAQVEQLTAQSPYIRTDFLANWVHRGCGAAKEILYLTPYGDVLTCPFLHIGFGNIFEDSLKTIRERALSVDWFKTYQPKCLASTDAEFIQKHLSKTFNRKDLPVSWREVF